MFEETIDRYQTGKRLGVSAIETNRLVETGDLAVSNSRKPTTKTRGNAIKEHVMKQFRKRNVISLTVLALMLTLFVGTAAAMSTGPHETNRWTNVWSGPGEGSPIGVLAPNTIVNVVGYNAANNWAQITSSAADGWVPSDALMLVASGDAASSSDGCVIPPSGPWPPCATGGNTAPATSTGNVDCIIPESGPWPPCATGGGHSGPAPAQNTDSSDDCVIPPSGPWPPCAAGGNAAPTGSPANTPAESPAMAEPPVTTTAEPERFAESPVKPFDAEEFRMFLGLFRDSLRSFLTDILEDRPIHCGSYVGWLRLWVVESPVYTDVPPEFQELHFLWRAMLTEVVELSDVPRRYCDGSSDVNEFDATALFEYLLFAYPISEGMVTEANSIPNP